MYTLILTSPSKNERYKDDASKAKGSTYSSMKLFRLFKRRIVFSKV